MNPFGRSVPQMPGTGDGFTFSTFIELREERRFLYTKNREPPGRRLRPGQDVRHTPDIGRYAGTGLGLTGSRQRNERSQTWTTRI